MAGSVFFQAVDKWLEGKGFHVHLAREGTLDGHALRKSLADLKDSGCAMGDGDCAHTYIKGVLTQLKNVAGWTEEQSRSALKAADFNPDDFELG